MERTEVLEKIKNCISDKSGIDVSKVEEKSDFNLDLGLDSLDGVEVIIEAEKIFNISISDDETKGITCVEDLVNLIENKLNS